MEEGTYLAWQARRRQALKERTRVSKNERARERRKNGSDKRCLKYKCGRVRAGEPYCKGHGAEYVSATVPRTHNMPDDDLDCSEPENVKSCDTSHNGSDKSAHGYDTSAIKTSDFSTKQSALRVEDVNIEDIAASTNMADMAAAWEARAAEERALAYMAYREAERKQRREERRIANAAKEQMSTKPVGAADTAAAPVNIYTFPHHATPYAC